MSDALTFDPIWEQIYGEDLHLNRYPWDAVVSFVFRNYPRSKPRPQVNILEVGCGAGSNLWFAAREGFQVAGIDASPSAIEYAKKRFAEEGLTGDFQVGDFTSLPFEDKSFDLVIDRAAITCCGLSAASRAISEIRRVLVDSGKFLFCPYSDRHSSHASGYAGSDGLTLGISAGTITGVGQICFWSRSDIDKQFAEGWRLLSAQHVESVEELDAERGTHAEWRVIVEKI